LTLVVGEEVPVNRCKISQNFSPADVTSPFVAKTEQFWDNVRDDRNRTPNRLPAE
jgi:hypothetical protein